MRIGSVMDGDFSAYLRLTDVEFQRTEPADLQRRMWAAASRIEALEADLFGPMGDNHHNAARCPYCQEPLTKAERALAELREAAERVGATRHATGARQEAIENLLALLAPQQESGS
jgi:hypothetical protein